MPFSGKEKDVTPLSDSSASDYRFVSSLRDPTANSVDESPDRTRNSSVSSPVSPATSSPTRKSFESGPPKQYEPTSSGESTIQGHMSSSESNPTFTSLSGSQPFHLEPPHRPEPHSHISTQSAPAHVTLPSPTLSSPTVTSMPSTPTTRTFNKPTPPTKLEFPDGPLRVLVVDDDNLTRRLMGRMMSRLGCTVESAENGKIALDLMTAPKPGSEGGSLVEQGEIEFDAEERGEPMPAKKKTAFGIDPRSGVDAHKHFDIVFLDNQVCLRFANTRATTKFRS